MSKQGQEPTDVQAGMKENQTEVANCIESDICFSGFARESQTDGIVACSDSSSYIEVNGGINNLKEVSVQSECISGYSSNWQRQCPLNPVASALANVASAASTTTASERINRTHSGCGFDELFPMHVTLSAQQNSWIVNCRPRKHQNVIPSKHPYDNDINLLAGARGAFSHTRVSEFAPITPDKPTRAEMEEVSEIENLYIENRTEKRDEQANELIDLTVDVNGLQCNEELQMPVSESSMIATPSKENQNPDSGGSLLAEPEITTPQQKQRKRKHRPKVITERKPRKPRKPVTPKPGGTQETPTGKRKYVRKNTVKTDTSILPGEENAEKPTGKRKYVRRKGLDKDSMIPAQEEIEKGTTLPETLELNKKPCRRALDFNTEGQERDDSSACKPTWNLNSSSGTENLCKEGSQCGIEVAADKPQTDIGFELNQSVNQKLKENLSLPDDQAPGTTLPTKNNPSHRRQNTHSQKLKTGKGKGKATAHDGLKMNEQPELDSNAQLPARSPINTECRSSLLLEGGQTNKSAATQQADTSVVNSYGSHYNSLYAYQILLGMVFPKIQKRKRTGKGRNAETSSASSSITPEETCLADKGEVNTHGGVTTKLEAGKKFSMDKLQTFYCKFSMFNILNGSTSFVQLLKMVGSARIHEVYSHQTMSANWNSKVKTSQFHNHPRENCDNSGPKSFTGDDLMPSANYHPYHTLNSEVREIGHFEKEETRSSKPSKKKDENIIKRPSPLTQESACHTMDQNKKIKCVQVPQQFSFEINQSSNNTQPDEMTVSNCQKGMLQDTINLVESSADAENTAMLMHVNMSKRPEETLDITESTTAFDNQRMPQQKMQESNLCTHDSSSNKELNSMARGFKSEGKKVKKEKVDDFDWDSLRKQAQANGRKRERTEKTMDSLDWEAVRCSEVNEIAETIKERGMNNVLAQRIKDFLNRLVKDHGSIDMEWLRDVPPDKAKEYLLSIRGLGLKSVECMRLLTLHHLAFPVDTNVGRIAVRLGWVPLQPLPESLQLHLLEMYPILESIQKYLWPRLCKLDQRTLYELHYQMITFGKVFCTKSKPNCNACPMRGECRHFASAFASARLALPGPEEKSIVRATGNGTSDQNHAVTIDQLALPLPQPNELSDRNCQSETNQQLEAVSGVNKCNPIIEEPASPEPECTQVVENDIEDMFSEDPDEIPTIKLNMEEFTQTLQNYMQNNMELQEVDMSKALVALTAEAASIPTPRLKNVNRLRTEHQVYELPDSHPLLNELDKREPDDPGKYLLAIWTPGETANSFELPERRCNSQEHGKLCEEETCFACNNVREAESHIVRGTLLIPCRTAMRGSFPLNGTYFQVNEVFADHDSSLNPIAVPREWIWNLPRRMVYFGTSVTSIFKGLTTEGIQHCFWRGYVCVRGFHQKSRAPRPLMARLHFVASKLAKGKGKGAAEDEQR